MRWLCRGRRDEDEEPRSRSCAVPARVWTPDPRVLNSFRAAGFRDGRGSGEREADGGRRCGARARADDGRDGRRRRRRHRLLPDVPQAQTRLHVRAFRSRGARRRRRPSLARARASPNRSRHPSRARPGSKPKVKASFVARGVTSRISRRSTHRAGPRRRVHNLQRRRPSADVLRTGTWRGTGRVRVRVRLSLAVKRKTNPGRKADDDASLTWARPSSAQRRYEEESKVDGSPRRVLSAKETMGPAWPRRPRGDRREDRRGQARGIRPKPPRGVPAASRQIQTPTSR